MATRLWHKAVIIATVIAVSSVATVQAVDDEIVVFNSQQVGDDCPPWFIYDAPRNRCTCSSEGRDNVKCTEKGALLKFGNCMTYENGSTTAVSCCRYFLLQPSMHNITEQRFISLPHDFRELNDYMCGPMKRKGLICSECIDGFGPSLTSVGFQCADCAEAWYGIPLLLVLEFVPVTVLYLIILFFQVSLTSAPMTSFILFSQLSVYAATGVDAQTRSVLQHVSPSGYQTFVSLITLYGMFNLDFFRHVIPPFCISENLRIIHVVVLGYLSAFYPLFLMGITYCLFTKVKVHGCESIPCCQNKIAQYFVKTGKAFNTNNSIINVFASFLLLSYTKFMLLFTASFASVNIVNINGSLIGTRLDMDPSVLYFSAEHISFFVLGILSLIGPVILSALVLTLYPIRRFRDFLQRCHCSGRSIAALNIFVETFYSCYRDGLDGGRDMRSFAGFYFFVRLLMLIIVAAIEPSLKSYGIAMWIAVAMLFAASSVLIAIVQPYKKRYMNVIDTLVLFNVVVVASITSMFYVSSHFPDSIPFSPRLLFWMTIISYSIPIIGYAVYFVKCILKSKRLTASWIKLKKMCSSRKHLDCGVTNPIQSTLDNELPDRLLHPEQYCTNATYNAYI